jgi:ZIP family zinc transporter
MLASACLFLLPPAVEHHSAFGGMGIAAGLIAGFVLHTANRRLTRQSELALDASVLELSIHSLAAGLIIGTIYSADPSLDLILGFAIVSHKGPAGFAVARRLAHRGKSADVIQLPAAAVGLSALSVGIVGVSIPSGFKGLVFGFAAGVFLHVAIAFLPQCRVGGKIHELINAEDVYSRLDELRHHAVVSTIVGATVVFALWSVL